MNNPGNEHRIVAFPVTISCEATWCDSGCANRGVRRKRSHRSLNSQTLRRNSSAPCSFVHATAVFDKRPPDTTPAYILYDADLLNVPDQPPFQPVIVTRPLGFEHEVADNLSGLCRDIHCARMFLRRYA